MSECQLCHHDAHPDPAQACGVYIGIPATMDEPGLDLCDCSGNCCDVCVGLREPPKGATP